MKIQDLCPLWGGDQFEHCTAKTNFSPGGERNRQGANREGGGGFVGKGGEEKMSRVGMLYEVKGGKTLVERLS